MHKLLGIAVGIAIVALLAAGGWWFMTMRPLATDVLQPNTQAPAATDIVPTGVVHDVTYTDDGFSPKDLFIKIGDTVRWNNKSTVEMWVGSSVHPTHSVYSGTTLSEHCTGGPSATAFDQCEGGETYSFVFTKTGTWRYHDHITPYNTGSVTVE